MTAYVTFGKRATPDRTIEEVWRNLCAGYLCALFSGAPDQEIQDRAVALGAAAHEMRESMMRAAA